MFNSGVLTQADSFTRASRKVAAAAVVVLVVDPPVIVFYDSAPTPSRPQTLRRILDHPKTWSDERNQPRAHRS